MSTDVMSASRGLITTSSSLAELRRFLATDAGLPAARQRDMISALSSLARALGRPAEAIVADPAQLRASIAPLTPAMVGMNPDAGETSRAWSMLRSAMSAS